MLLPFLSWAADAAHVRCFLIQNYRDPLILCVRFEKTGQNVRSDPFGSNLKEMGQRFVNTSISGKQSVQGIAFVGIVLQVAVDTHKFEYDGKFMPKSGA